MQTQTLWYLLAALLGLAGLAGTVLPVLPGIPLLYAGMLLAAWAGGFEQVGAMALTLLGVLTLLSLLLDFWATAMGARRVGASRAALLGTVLGTLVGLFFGLPGVFIGPFAGAMAGELWHRRRHGLAGVGPATRVGVGTWVGIAVAAALKLALAFVMIGIFALAWLT